VLKRRRITLNGKGKNKAGPCPKCGGTDRFAINTEKRLFNCRHCMQGGDVIDLIRFLYDVDFAEACEILAGEPVIITNSHTTSSPSDDTAQRIAQAQAIWDSAVDPRGTAAQRYLHSRKLLLPAELCNSVLRFHPRCPWEKGSVPALVVPFRCIKTNNFTGVHRIRLDQPERWPKKERRKMFGVIAGSAIKFDSAGAALAISEGVESALAARQLGLKPIWAFGSRVGIQKFELIDGVDELLILGERDGGINQAAAQECASRWGGRAMLLMPPAEYKDFNDVLMERTNAAA
jgi:hypothetical protein